MRKTVGPPSGWTSYTFSPPCSLRVQTLAQVPLRAPRIVSAHGGKAHAARVGSYRDGSRVGSADSSPQPLHNPFARALGLASASVTSDDNASGRTFPRCP